MDWSEWYETLTNTVWACNCLPSVLLDDIFLNGRGEMRTHYLPKPTSASSCLFPVVMVLPQSSQPHSRLVPFRPGVLRLLFPKSTLLFFLLIIDPQLSSFSRAHGHGGRSKISQAPLQPGVTMWPHLHQRNWSAVSLKEMDSLWTSSPSSFSLTGMWIEWCCSSFDHVDKNTTLGTCRAAREKEPRSLDALLAQSL